MRARFNEPHASTTPKPQSHEFKKLAACNSISLAQLTDMTYRTSPLVPTARRPIDPSRPSIPSTALEPCPPCPSERLAACRHLAGVSEKGCASAQTPTCNQRLDRHTAAAGGPFSTYARDGGCCGKACSDVVCVFVVWATRLVSESCGFCATCSIVK